MAALPLLLELGINRNIVECKYSTSFNFHKFKTRINRNIVECKFELLRPFLGFRRELIETLWNVNVNPFL